MVYEVCRRLPCYEVMNIIIVSNLFWGDKLVKLSNVQYERHLYQINWSHKHISAILCTTHTYYATFLFNCIVLEEFSLILYCLQNCYFVGKFKFICNFGFTEWDEAVLVDSQLQSAEAVQLAHLLIFLHSLPPSETYNLFNSSVCWKQVNSDSVTLFLSR